MICDEDTKIVPEHRDNSPVAGCSGLQGTSDTVNMAYNGEDDGNDWEGSCDRWMGQMSCGDGQ